jgi:hypothetical protein
MFRKVNNNKCTDSSYSLYLLLIVSLCICSCTSENNIFDNDNSKLLNFSVSVPEWKNNDGTSCCKTRAMPISGTSLGTSSNFNIIADAYDGNSSYSTIINNEAVSYTNNMWKTTVSHYWPGNANNTVNFYAYYPTSISSSISHTAGSAPTLSYTVPNDVASQIDIMTATGTNVSGKTNSSTPLAFGHVFAAVKFAVGSNGLPSGTVKSITISGINNSGTYTFGSGWTLGSTTSSFTVLPSTTITGTAGANITSDAFTMMMIPQTFSNATVTLVYSNGTTFSTTISGTWNAGSFYTYNLSKTVAFNYNYTGAVQTFTAPYAGTYKLEVYGAQGGDQTYGHGGKGGKSTGYIHLNSKDNIYICIGGQGMQNISDVAVDLNSGGYNGGGGLNTAKYGSTGGGATHIAITNRGTLTNYLSYQNEIVIVAGGGGGASYWPNAYNTIDGIAMPINSCYDGGYGGGTIGGSSNGTSSNQNGILSYSGGTQTEPGNGFILSNSIGGFGYGGKAHGGGCCGGGGGSGWYGGMGGYDNSAGSGGSGYINTNYITNGIMENNICSGNGYARITFVSAN